MPPETQPVTSDVWGALFIAFCLLPFALLAIAAAIKPLMTRPVPWYDDEQADSMRELGIDPDERWSRTEI